MWTFDTGALTWLVVAIIAAVIELLNPQFGLIFVSFAAAVAAIASGFGAGFGTEILLFIVTLAGSLALLRPMFLDKLHGRGVPGRTDTLIGKSGVVTEEIDPVRGTGRINVGGEDWAARSVFDIEVGARVKVTGADGIVLEVTRA